MELARGRRNPFTQVGDWVSLSSVSKTAKLLYVMLAMHVSQLRDDASVWPSRAALAALLDYSKTESIDPFIKELVKLGAIDVKRRRKADGSPDTNLYIVHETPPPGYQGITTLKEFYEQFHEKRSLKQGVPPKSGGGVPPISGGGVPPKSGDELYVVELDEVELEKTSPNIAEKQPSPAVVADASGAEDRAVLPRDDVEALCQHLAAWVVRNGSKEPKITKAWRDEARRMLDLDKREFAKAMALIDWCQQNTFWRSNIRSMTKFRDQYDTLRLQAVAEWEAKPKGGGRANDLVEHNGDLVTRRTAAARDVIAKLEAQEAENPAPRVELPASNPYSVLLQRSGRELEGAAL